MAKSTTKTAGQRLTAAEKRATALQLREAGLSFEKIAAQVGCSTSRAHQYVKEQLDKLAAKADESGDAIRQLELERLDRMTTGVWPKAQRGDLLSVDRMLKIMARRAKLLGLDSPTLMAQTTKDGDDVASGVFVVPAPAASLDDWLAQVQAHEQAKEAESSD